MPNLPEILAATFPACILVESNRSLRNRIIGNTALSISYPQDSGAARYSEGSLLQRFQGGQNGLSFLEVGVGAGIQKGSNGAHADNITNALMKHHCKHNVSFCMLSTVF